MCLIIVGKHLTYIYLPHWKSWLQLELLTAKYFWEHCVFSCMIKCRDWTLKGNADFYQRLTRGRARFKHGGMLALLKYPFYLLFNFDNGMNLISKSLTILTSAQLLVIFAFAHILWRYFVFAGFWPIMEHEMVRPTITRWHEERQRPKPEQRTQGHDD